jgi:molybdopterin synthase catalytic subunit/molybdopterin converting factor small subunit
VRIDGTAFAALRDALGAVRVTVELPEGATGADLKANLARTHPRWSDLIAACRLVQDVDFIAETAPLRDGSTVALIPPVSGGAPSPEETGAVPEMLLTSDPLDGEAIKRAVARPAAGAVVVFEGTVRSPSEGREVRWLEYEAYDDMARVQMRRLLDETHTRWPDVVVALHHRLGRVEVGEPSVVVAASAPHRAQAFEACRHLIEGLKADVPIWKKEVFADGSVWVGAPGACRTHDHGNAEPEP